AARRSCPTSSRRRGTARTAVGSGTGGWSRSCGEATDEAALRRCSREVGGDEFTRRSGCVHGGAGRARIPSEPLPRCRPREGPEMPLPNFLVVGSQKSGTSWLHHGLGRSRHVFASEVKELNFFNQPDFDAPAKVTALREHFPAQDPGVRYYLESTPHYFRARPTTAENIRSLLGSPAMVAVFRNPVQRYESAYIHHMMKGRFPYTATIDQLTDEYSVLSLG